ncbi:MAG TPA: class I SAM-dependent methyltransferase [Acetobacteraceae bacterium]|nr:class I SAM-dependent methyltransferase [Acetobacteraceae bacterium]
MAQNIYDDPDFLAGYSQLARSVSGLDGAAEWPSMRALLPDLRGCRVVDLGCGFGWFCRWAREQGAASVLGLDVSEQMLAHARAATGDETIAYQTADLETLELPPVLFDLAYSSLALHYVEHLAPLLTTVHRALVPGGHLVFSMEHPIYMAPSRPEWLGTEDGRRVWPLDQYLIEGKRLTDWFAKGVVKYHRTIGTTLTLLIRLGFSIRHVQEWCPTAEQVAAKPELAQERDRPMFLLVAAQR